MQLHKSGIAHRHAEEDAVLHEARDILLDIMGTKELGPVNGLRVSLTQSSP